MAFCSTKVIRNAKSNFRDHHDMPRHRAKMISPSFNLSSFLIEIPIKYPRNYVISFTPQVVGLCNSHYSWLPGPGRYGHLWHLRPLCKSFSSARQEKEIRDKNSPEDFESGLQWNFQIHGWFWSIFDVASFSWRLVWQVPYGDVMGKTLVFAVFDFDRFTKNDEIGEVKNS